MSDTSHKNILIIGGTRFIGPYVVRRLSSRGHRLLLFNRGQTPATTINDIEMIHGDRANIASFRKDIHSFSPEIVIDMIPVTGHDAKSLLSVIKPLHPRVVVISSQDVYHAWGRLIGVENGEPADLPITEESPLRATRYPYRKQGGRLTDYDKIIIEETYLSDDAMDVAVLRLPMVYGPGDYQHRLYQYLKKMDDNRPHIVLEETESRWRWTTGYVENIAEAIVLATFHKQAAGKIYNIGNPDTPDLKTWIRAIGDAAGWNGKIYTVPREYFPESIKTRESLTQDIIVSSERIRGELGYRDPVSLSEGLAKTVAWERNHPPEKIPLEELDYAAEDDIVMRFKNRKK